MISCPRCKSSGSNIVLTEMWTNHRIEFEQRDDGKIEEQGVLLEGSPYKVTGSCLSCLKTWTLKRVLQITNLPGYPI